MKVKLWLGHKKFLVKQWLKAHRVHFVAIISTSVLVAGALYFMFTWLETEMLKIQFPNSELHIIKQVKAAELPKETPKVAEAPKIDLQEVVAKVRMLESSGGKNDKCVRKGKGYNGYGYGQSLTKDNCYKSVAEVKKLVITWFDRNLDTMTLPQALCYYNLGKPEKELLNNCEYYQNYLKL